MLSKIIVIGFLVAILFFLGSGLIHLVRHKGNGTKMVKSLTWRIGLSIGLFILLFIGFAAGLIQPHSI